MNKQLSLGFVTSDGTPVESTLDTAREAEILDLRRRVAVLEAWVAMVEGHVTGPMSALPTLDEASLRVPGRR
jgi:hypothetical protein